MVDDRTMANERTPPLGELKYLYVGTSRFDEDLAYYRDVVGAEEVWNFEEFGRRSRSLGIWLCHRRSARRAGLDRAPDPSLSPAPAARASSLWETSRAAS